MSEELESELRAMVKMLALLTLVPVVFTFLLALIFLCVMAASHYIEVIATHWGIY